MSILQKFQRKLAFLRATIAAASVYKQLDQNTREHSFRVSKLAHQFGQALGLEPSRIAEIALGAFMHDAGKLNVDPHLLSKSDELSTEERLAVQAHGVWGMLFADRLPGIRHLPELWAAIAAHHERLDGSGYPAALVGHEVPFAARLVAICDAFDAMTSERPYQLPMTREQALTQLICDSGSHFDERLVHAFVEMIMGAAPRLLAALA